MKTPLTTFLTLLLAACVFGVAASAYAGPRDGRQYGDRGVSKRDAARIVKERYGGRVLDVRPRRGNGDGGYRVKILDGGRVKVLGVDGRTGEIRD